MPRMALGLSAVLFLCLASPSQLPAWTGLLVLPGLAAFYAVISRSRRPLLWAYGIALIYYLWFSWSLRHVTWGGYVAISMLGPFYELLPVLWLRARRRVLPSSLAFACGIAAGQWCRAHMPEIHYPHGQWAHSLYLWPSLCGPVSWGGEVLANGLLAWLGAASVDLYRSWRLAEPGWVSAKLCVLLPATLWIGSCLFDPPRPAATPRRVSLAVVEPGDGAAFRFDYDRYLRRFRELLLVPTRELAADLSVPALDLILWPEAAVSFNALRGTPARWNRFKLDLSQLRLPTTTRLLLGSSLIEDQRVYAASVLLAADGQLVAWQEKRVPVPAGETMPFVHLLPAFLEDPLREWAASVVGNLVDLQPGRQRPLLETAAGIRFSALLCYDNAFDQIARSEVGRGARFLAVLSNEAWYMGGAELDQMVAMSVFRALETASPVIRCTVDGATVMIDAKGRKVAELSPRAASEGVPRVLALELAVGPGGLGAMAWLHGFLPWLLLIAALPLLPTRPKSWAKILRRPARLPVVGGLDENR